MAWTKNRENKLHQAVLAKLKDGSFVMKDIVDSCLFITHNRCAIENHVHELCSYDIITYSGGDKGFFSLCEDGK
jgi:hypothetical protein